MGVFHITGIEWHTALPMLFPAVLRSACFREFRALKKVLPTYCVLKWNMLLYICHLKLNIGGTNNGSMWMQSKESGEKGPGGQETCGKEESCGKEEIRQ